MRPGSNTLHMFKPQWKKFRVHLKDHGGSGVTDIQEVYALNANQAGFLGMRQSKLMVGVDWVEEIAKDAS